MKKQLSAAALLAVCCIGLYSTTSAIAAPYDPEPTPTTQLAPAAERAENDAILDVPFKNDVQEIEQALLKAGLLTDYPDILAYTTLDGENSVFELGYNGTGSSDRVAKFLEAASLVKTDSTLRLQPVDVGFSRADRKSVSHSVLKDRIKWASQLGVTQINATSVDTDTGAIIVHVPEKIEPREVEVAGERFLIEGDVSEMVPASRYNDDAPWTGGVRLVSNTDPTFLIHCTAGYTWRTWSNNELRGSTAEHCYTNSGVSTLYNYGTLVGVRYGANANVDTMLIRSTPIGQFSASVFVGSYTTSDIRSVVGADAVPTTGEAVALSGGVSGLGTGWINNPDYAWIGPNGVFITGVRTNYPECFKGDSGGPWLTTNSAGGAIAHGQLYGWNMNGTVKNCTFVHVQDISATLQVTLATRP